MKKIFSFILLMIAVLTLAACSERRYGEGEVVEVLINPSGDPSSQFFVNLHLFNHSNEDVSVVVEGFEYLDDENWVPIPPVSDEEWVLDFELDLGIEDFNKGFSTALRFNEWLNPDYPTLGTFRVSVRVYNLAGEYLFTQASNERELEYFTFDE